MALSKQRAWDFCYCSVALEPALLNKTPTHIRLPPPNYSVAQKQIIFPH
jgi:hypothetical protein